MFVAKSIDELYDEVKDFDLVMCNDAPLALALNNRLDRPRVGTFAITPRQLAGDLAMDILGEPMMTDIEVVRKISRYTGYPLRFVHGEVENIKTIRRYAKNVKDYLGGHRSKEIYDEFIRLPTLEKAMDMVDGHTEPFFANKRVAVIGLDLYDSLDKNFDPKPGTFEEIELFKNPYKHGTYEIKEFRELYNDHQMAENAVYMIEDQNPTDVAIVLDVNGPIADAVRSELYRKNIPFINELSIRDLNSIRDFIEFINRSLNYNITKVSQVRELLQTYGGYISPKYDEYLIENLSHNRNGIRIDGRTSDLLSIMRDVEGYTYGEVCNSITGSEGAQVKLLLSQLELTDRKVNPADTADMVYSVNNFDLKHNEQIPNTEKEGVLLVDCNNSVYIDRQIVIYLGLGPEWERDLSDLNLIDYKMKDSLVEKNVIKFQIMLQQGTSRTYICNSVKNGKEAKPCPYFQKAYNSVDKDCRPLKDEDGEGYDVVYDRFSDIAGCISGPWYNYEKNKAEKVGVHIISPEPRDFQFSSTSYSSFITCPKKFMFGSVVKTPDESHTALGLCLHQYAEFRSCFPDKAKELGQEYFVDDINNRCTPLFSPEIRKLRESKIRSAVKELDDLISTFGLDRDVRIIDKERKHENVYFGLVDMDGKGSDSNEVSIVDRDRHMNGTLDVIKDNRVFDFKTGSPKDVDKVKNGLKLDGRSDYGKDLQCLFYLSLMMKDGVGKPSFSFFSTSANEIREALGLQRDPDAAFVNVVLVDDKTECMYRVFPQDLSSRGDSYDTFKPLCDDMMDTIASIGIENAVGDYEGTKTRLIQALGLKDQKGIRDGLNVLLNSIRKIVDSQYYSNGNTIYVTRDEMEAFRSKLSESYDLEESYYSTTYPTEPMMDCKNCDFRDMCIVKVDGGDDDE